MRNKLGQYKRKYHLNEHYFDKIDDEHKAYWLGFLYADGYNDERRGRIVVSLHGKDIEILQNFLKDLNSNHLIRKSKHTYTDNDICTIELSSRHLSQTLAKLGCYQCKSLTLSFPSSKYISKKFLAPFLRGMWDGDGEIKINKFSNRKYLYPHIAIYSSKVFCEQLQTVLTKLNFKSHIINMRNPLNKSLYIKGGKKEIKKFLVWLYKDASIYLNRKYANYLTILDMPDRKERQSKPRHPQ